MGNGDVSPEWVSKVESKVDQAIRDIAKVQASIESLKGQDVNLEQFLSFQRDTLAELKAQGITHTEKVEGIQRGLNALRTEVKTEIVDLDRRVRMMEDTHAEFDDWKRWAIKTIAAPIILTLLAVAAMFVTSSGWPR